MPTPRKEAQVEEIKDKLSRCTIAITTGYQGLSASDMTELRKRLREQGIEYKVVKNTLTLRAAQELGKEGIGDVMQGPTGLVFGYGDEVAVARGLNTFITSTRSPLVINGALMDSRIITGDQVRNLATLPPREELLSRLLGQMQAPVTGLVTVLSAPLRGLVTVLQRAAESGGAAVADAPAEVVEEPRRRRKRPRRRTARQWRLRPKSQRSLRRRRKSRKSQMKRSRRPKRKKRPRLRRPLSSGGTQSTKSQIKKERKDDKGRGT